MQQSRFTAIGMYFTAVIELCVGGGFLVTAYLDAVPEATTTFWIVGGVLACSGLLFAYIGKRAWSRYDDAKRIRSTGIAAEAQVIAARQTSLEVNGQPQLELTMRVTVPGRDAYQVKRKEIVPMLALGRVSTGMPLKVYVDPSDPEKVVIDWAAPVAVQVPSFGVPAGFGAPAAFGAPGAFGAAKMAGPAPFQPPVDPAELARVKQQILATGIPGVARVLTATYTGDLDDQSRPVYDLALHIQVNDGRAPVSGGGRMGVPVERVAVMQPGGVIPIKVDPFDPTKIAADWDRPQP